MAETEIRKPRSVGRIVHYGVGEAEVGSGEIIARPAIVVHSWSDEVVNLQVFTDGSNDQQRLGPQALEGLAWKTSIHYSDHPQVNRWWWPVRI